MYPSFLNDDQVMEIEQAFDRIVAAVTDTKQNAEFLIGAGMSAGAKVPPGNRLGEILLDRIFPPSGRSPLATEDYSDFRARYPLETLASVVQWTVAGRGREDLKAMLQSVYLDPHFELPNAHRHLATIAGRPHSISQLFTTNFDGLLTRALGARACPITWKNTQDAKPAIRADRIPIYHLHGRIENDTFQISELDLLSPDSDRMINEFSQALQDADIFTFVGYSMRDPDFRSIYAQYQKRLLARRDLGPMKSTFVVGPPDSSRDAASSGRDYSLGKRVWQARGGAIWLPLTADDFFQHLLKLITQRENNQQKIEIMQKYSLNSEEELNEKVMSLMDLLKIAEPDALDFLSATRIHNKI